MVSLYFCCGISLKILTYNHVSCPLVTIGFTSRFMGSTCIVNLLLQDMLDVLDSEASKGSQWKLWGKPWENYWLVGCFDCLIHEISECLPTNFFCHIW